MPTSSEWERGDSIWRASSSALHHHAWQHLSVLWKRLGVVALPAREPERDTARAMSQENVEIVRRFMRRFIDQYGDAPSDLQGLAANFFEPDADYYPVQKFPEARPCHGVEEIARFQADYRDAWDRYEMEVNQLTPVSDDRVLAHSTIRAEGRESGVKLDGDLYQCVWLRHGRFMRWEDHLSVKGALRALGLSGETLEAAGLRE
jgi:hypothetical protein